MSFRLRASLLHDIGKLGILSRILTVADIYDALSAAHPYHGPFPKEKALEMMGRDSGTRLCPEVVTIL